MARIRLFRPLSTNYTLSYALSAHLSDSLALPIHYSSFFQFLCYSQAFIYLGVSSSLNSLARLLICICLSLFCFLFSIKLNVGYSILAFFFRSFIKACFDYLDFLSQFLNLKNLFSNWIS